MSKPYIFNSVMVKLFGDLSKLLIRKLDKWKNYSEDLQTRRNLINFLQSDIRELPQYSSIINTISKTANYDIQNILNYLN